MTTPLTAHCFRHGESAANAGLATTDPALIPLTGFGRQQAQTLGLSNASLPLARIISSPFLRAQQTALPTLGNFLGLCLEHWAVQEFTYLSPKRCAGTTGMQRKAWVQSYWQKADPHYEDGDGAESFATFIGRVKATLSQLQQLYWEGETTIALFGHGQFMQALRWVAQGGAQTVDAGAMQTFRELDHAHPIANTGGFSIAFNGASWV